MHAYALIRGVKHLSDYFISQLQGKNLPYKVKKGAAGFKAGDYHIPVGVRPIQLYEITFPKEHKDLMLTTIFGKKLNSEQYKKNKIGVSFLRKMLGVKPIPEYDDKLKLPITKDHIEIFGVGIKEDENFKDGTEAL